MKIQLGQLITDKDQQRDAAHVAILPATARSPIRPGNFVTIKDGLAQTSFKGEGSIGMADPFLEAEWILKGQRFWILMTPGTTSEVIHYWTHPYVEDTIHTQPRKTMNKDEWDKYLNGVAQTLEVDRWTLQESANQYAMDGYCSNQPAWNYADMDWSEFWDKFNAAHGTNVQSNECPFCC